MSKKILVVDDDEMNLRMAEFVLKQNSYEVYKAESGMECLDFLKNQKVDLILLDIEMPTMNGIKTLEIMKENSELADIPVIFLTASVDSDIAAEADRLGVVDCVTKPFMPQELLKRVEKAVM